MTPTRTVFLLCALVTACGGSDDEKSSASGGTGGAATGGSAGTGATGGGATGGTSATGGTAGSSGSSGSGGSGGSGGSAGALGREHRITDPSAKPDHVYDCSGLKWNVSVPDACTTTSCGLIFDVH